MNNVNMFLATKEELSKELDDLIEPVINYIKENWNVKSTIPNNFNSIIDALNESDIDKIDEFQNDNKRIVKTYNGLIDDEPGYASCAINRMLSPWYIAYGKHDQGEEPINTLISTLICFGMDLQKNRDRVGYECQGKIIEKETTQKCKQLITTKINKIIIELCETHRNNQDTVNKLVSLFNMTNLLNCNVIDISEDKIQEVCK